MASGGTPHDTAGPQNTGSAGLNGLNLPGITSSCSASSGQQTQVSISAVGPADGARHEVDVTRACGQRGILRKMGGPTRASTLVESDFTTTVFIYSVTGRYLYSLSSVQVSCSKTRGRINLPLLKSAAAPE